MLYFKFQEELLNEQEVDDPHSINSSSSLPSLPEKGKAKTAGKGTTVNNVAHCTATLGVINNQIEKKAEVQKDFQEKNSKNV